MLDEFLEKLPIKPLYLAISAGVVGLVLVFTLLLSPGQSQQESALAEAPLAQLDTGSQISSSAASSSKVEVVSSQSQSADEWVIDIKGQVKSPGVYEVAEGARVHDVVKMAGGLTDKAEPKSINLAAKLQDEAVIYVAAQGESAAQLVTTSGSAQSIEASGSSASDSGQVNLNTASETELQTITGVGQKRAQDIIAYREANGGFKTVDDLNNVSGIGDKTLENMRPYVTVD